MCDNRKNFIIAVACPARSGIVVSVVSFLTGSNCYISELSQFDDEQSGRFFLRARFYFNDLLDEDIDALRSGFNVVAEQFLMEWGIHDSATSMRVLVMVSKEDHCLEDLLYRRRKGELQIDIPAIISNHLDLKSIADREAIPFIFLPVTSDNKSEQEGKLLDIVMETRSELIVLARYMQVFSDSLCQELFGRVINIHHSFLPGFKGGRAYHQAFERGVKLIGATSHYVTPDLDEGPIIDQEVRPVDHTYLTEDLVAAGRQTETVALSRSVKYHIEHRVFINGNKTVVIK